eukprot:CAMPEP_0116063202 /NCGR_PEP_ID=MMETSP0322-20121206/8273_1 /TAXON_ID=163516 /ORGANISM="Leptocylindrus danicus var. apora, Strain B651" /LENGTH=411 /DNA_ID=CAMNT_0003548773 /DNA_START=133 /DNA_END=1368 /DNA_ORIENTATION=-
MEHYPLILPLAGLLLIGVSDAFSSVPRNTFMEVSTSTSFSLHALSNDENDNMSLIGKCCSRSEAIYGILAGAVAIGGSPQLSGAAETESSSMPLCEDPEVRTMGVFERAAPSVVYIDTFIEQRDVFSPNVQEVPLGAGSGFVWDDKGHIVTNYHVVKSSRIAQVAILSKIFQDDPPEKNSDEFRSSAKGSTPLQNYRRSVYKARVIGVDPDKDIAVLKIDAPVFDLKPITVGESNNLRVGQKALAIGNPFGLDHSLTVGIVSGIGREVKSPSGRPISNVIQTDAAINPGNSGGTLLDSAGNLIGMNTAIYSPSGGSAGIGFAIPVETLKFVVKKLIVDGRVVRPVLGISFLQSAQARALGVKRGVLVLDVPPSSPAFKAGMRGTKRTADGLIEIGDVIIKVRGDKIDTEGL